MRDIRICDMTMKLAAGSKSPLLTFKEKLELAKLLDNLGVSAIEIEGIEKPKADSLRIKSIASLVRNCVLAVPVALDGSDVDDVWKALAEAAHPRLQVQAATSPARMEYAHHMKAASMQETIASAIAACAACTPDVEFVVDDATRTDAPFLRAVIAAAIDAGATTITVCDDAGTMLPDEFSAFIRGLRSDIPGLDGVALGISCSDRLFMAESNAIGAIVEGADEIKASSYPLEVISLPKISRILAEKGEACGVECPVNTTALKRTVAQIERICDQGLVKTGNDGQSGEATESFFLSVHDSQEAVAECVAKLGYDLSDDDLELVYEAFLRIASKKESLDERELDAIVASAALQVPPTYKLVRHVVNSGNFIKSTACIALEVNGETFERVAMGDGPIDAAFAAIEQIVGRHFELDDWQMQAVTEGQEAMGEAIIKLIADGRSYSGRGISTDITSASIRAYINALNKYVYEEEN
ncbi:MAG: hypothetical protein IJH87_01815 [Atopobiaceae bacterium]|nr:hypothetical protein [Atopobiaceae bacterium]